MNYLISSFDCLIACKEHYTIVSNVKYKIDKLEDCVVFPAEGSPFPLIANIASENVLKFKFEHDNYYFLFSKKWSGAFFTKIQHGLKEICISLSSNLIITLNGEVVLEKQVENVEYSHHEIEGEICLIYFRGKRNFVVVIKQEEVCYADYYDECNISEEKYFLTKKFDMLNHGEVCHVSKSNVEKYLVYLDEEDMLLKNEFLVHCFVDCLLAKNYKYCNMLLADEIACENETDLEKFFPDFDGFYPLNASTVFMFKKNTLAGIYKFDYEENKIINIHQLSSSSVELLLV